MLEKHRHLPTNQLEQDHNSTMIVDALKFLKSELITKRGIIVHCREFNTLQSLVDDYWKTISEFEAILRDTSRLTLVCQN